MVVMRVTLAHAILCGSRATRMMQRFVRGEKYLTDNDTTFVSNCALGEERKNELTCQRGAYCAPAGITEIGDHALLECSPYFVARDVPLCRCGSTWDRG